MRALSRFHAFYTSNRTREVTNWRAFVEISTNTRERTERHLHGTPWSCGSACVEATHSVACPSLWLTSRCAQLSLQYDITARHVVATTTREATGRAAVHRSTHAPATGPASPAAIHEAGPAWRSRRSRADRGCAAQTVDAITPAAQQQRSTARQISRYRRRATIAAHKLARASSLHQRSLQPRD